MMRRLSLSQRLALVFTSLLLLCAAAVCVVQLYSSAQYGNAMVQRLSVGLAQQIVAREPLLDALTASCWPMLRRRAISNASALTSCRYRRFSPAAPGRCTVTIRVARISARSSAWRR